MRGTFHDHGDLLDVLNNSIPDTSSPHLRGLNWTASHLSNGGGVGDHAHGALHLGQVTARDNSGGLVVDAALEASGAPVHKLDGALGLDGGNRSVHVLHSTINQIELWHQLSTSVQSRFQDSAQQVMSSLPRFSRHWSLRLG